MSAQRHAEAGEGCAHARAARSTTLGQVESHCPLRLTVGWPGARYRPRARARVEADAGGAASALRAIA
eukprot:11882433-Alexandrium_andersonii.AAC.1